MVATYIESNFCKCGNRLIVAFETKDGRLICGACHKKENQKNDEKEPMKRKSDFFMSDYGVGIGNNLFD